MATRIHTETFGSMAEADGFIHGVEYALSFCGEFDGPLPRIIGESRRDKTGNNWFVDMELEDEQ